MLEKPAPILPVESARVTFPERRDQRMLARLLHVDDPLRLAGYRAIVETGSALLGDERVETDIVVAAYDRTVQVLSDLAQGEVKFDWALEMSSRPPIEPSGSLHAAMEEVRRIKLQRAFFKEAHRTIEEPRHV